MRTRTLFILMAVFTIGIIGIAVGISVLSGSSTKAQLSQTVGAKILVDHIDRSVGDIGYSKGILYHSFPIKNTGDKDLEVANIATSCMCTKAFLRVNGKDGPSFGMKGMASPSSWKGILKPGQKAEIVAAFDPAYHGPSGVGQVTRTVSFDTNDPNSPYVEVTFEGVVTK